MMPPEIKHAPQDEIRERSKLEGRHLEGDDTSQTSTMGSLGNVEEQHPLIEKTSTPSKIQQLEKLGMEIGQKIRKETQSQMQNIKLMILRVFGEKVDPARDNDAAARVLQKRINEEIKNLPKREEKVIEGEGQGPIMQGLPPSLPSQALGTISGMGSKLAHQIPSVNEMRDKISQYGHDVEKVFKHELAHVKQKFVETFGEKVNPAKDLDSSVKDKLTRLNEDIKKLPRNERVIETQGTAEEVDPMDFDPNDPYENWI